MQPKISVIIPAYNEEKLIGRSIEALQKQTLPSDQYEIIVIDNNSTDNTYAIAKNYKVSVYLYKEIQRVAAARQFGASKAKAPILAFMDADSVADNDWLEAIVTHFAKNKSLMAVCGVALPNGGAMHVKMGFYSYNQFLRINQLFGIVLAWGFNFAIRKSAFDRIGGYNLALSSYDDAEIALRVKRNFGKKSIYYSQKLRVYTSTRKHDNLKILAIYVADNVKNFVNVVIFKRSRVTEIRNVR